MSNGQPLRSVADAQARARRRLPRPIYLACLGGAGTGRTLTRNREEFESVVLDARVGDEPLTLDLTTSVMGLPLSMPLILAPVGAQAIRPHAEALAARAARGAGIAFALSNVASLSLEQVLPHNELTLAQLYWAGPREHNQERIRRYRETGAAGLIVTMDWSKGTGADWPMGTIPRKVDWRAMVNFAPHAIPHPAWAIEFLSHGQIPTLEVPQFATRRHPHPTMMEAIDLIQSTPQPRWEEVAWIKEEWGGPLMVKGITHPDDARLAVEHGADAISVSNHGGNTIDDKQSAISALPRIVDAVGADVDVVIDGGVARGSDVVKALAYGAKAAMIGRGYLWALIARGEVGVSEILDVYRVGIEQALRTVKVSSVRDVARHHIMAPDDPRRSLSPRPFDRREVRATDR